jgi:hypothetical protein
MSNPDVRFAGGPTYNNGTRAVLFPFTLSSGMLELPANFYGGQGGTATVCIAPGNAGTFIRRLGGGVLVQRIGNNFRTYIKNTVWTDAVASPPVSYTIGSTASINVVQNGTATLVQQLGWQNLPADVEAASFRVSTSRPTNFIQYGSSYLFDAPLILSATATPTGGGASTTIYITFYTQWDH